MYCELQRWQINILLLELAQLNAQIAYSSVLIPFGALEYTVILSSLRFYARRRPTFCTEAKIVVVFGSEGSQQQFNPKRQKEGYFIGL